MKRNLFDEIKEGFDSLVKSRGQTRIELLKQEGNTLYRCQVIKEERRYRISRKVRVKDRIAPKDLTKYKGGIDPPSIQMFRTEEAAIAFLKGQGWILQ